MKVSVITLSNIHNYGSILQAYATDLILKRIGCSVEFVDYTSINGRKDQTLAAALDRHGLSKKSLKKFIYTCAWECDWRHNENIFSSFARKQLKFSKHYESSDDLKSCPPEADVYLSGSDMLWSSILNMGHNETQFYLDYAPCDKRKIAFSASIGEYSIDAEEQAFLEPLLSKYHFISMREASGVKLLADMGIDSIETLDPTLMIAPEEWVRIANSPKHKRPYLLIYFLHDHPRVLEQARRIAQERGLDVLRIAFSPKKMKGDQYLSFMPNVERFIGLFADADYVITDSFHGTAFSLNFGKEFLAVEPPRFMARLDNILEMTGTEDRAFKEDDSISIRRVDDINWVQVSKIFSEKRQVGYEYLTNAIYSEQ